MVAIRCFLLVLTEAPEVVFCPSLTLYIVCYRQHIACSASRRYLIYSEADFEVFRPAGATRCTDGGEIWHAGAFRHDRTFPLLHVKITIGATTGMYIGPKKLKFLLRFDQNVEYKGAYPSRDFHKICRVCTHFRMR